MKSILLVLSMFALFSVSTQAQSLFVSPGASLQNSTMSYSVETGLCYDKTMLSLQYSYTPKGYSDYLTANVYNKLLGVRKSSLWLYNSLTMDFKTQNFVYAPGVSVTYQLTKHLQPQFVFYLPIQNSKTIPGYSLSIGYCF